MTKLNRQWRLVRLVEGMPSLDDWRLEDRPAPEPEPGSFLARALFLDVAPYMRARIAPVRNYAPGVRPGEVMIGGAVARIVASRAPGWKEGDLVVTDFGFGWQEYALLRPEAVRRVDPALGPPEAFLDVLGLNGATAWFALFETGALRPGDRVLISAAAGSVGQLAGQLARIAGAVPFAVASTSAKLAWCRELGFEGGIAHRETPDLANALRALVPEGVDLFFDNTAGPIHDAVLQNLAPRARVVLVGTVSLADRLGRPDIGPRFFREILVARARIEGFLVLDFEKRWPEAWARLADLLRSGRIRTRYDVLDGLERMPEAFLRVLRGENLGKQLVRLAS
ncbi:MAG: NADP-dependent oxidoreductase [Geminicoccaceae bacterium]|nr:NADP-dependent oxidoreductase [Geminicoccaceae bacterium]MCX7629677.1 NADP-dependent oxidoreductase [Geminicoccaceae bacterium]MDW8123445.1 NADP-dependent oxidoreductase [Geminicoccaceae bacterium]MDW8342135.1 NADP-dependent oxidoreductase [Geminicoccaceae bacterium]